MQLSHEIGHVFNSLSVTNRFQAQITSLLDSGISLLAPFVALSRMRAGSRELAGPTATVARPGVADLV